MEEIDKVDTTVSVLRVDDSQSIQNVGVGGRTTGRFPTFVSEVPFHTSCDVKVRTCGTDDVVKGFEEVTTGGDITDYNTLGSQVSIHVLKDDNVNGQVIGDGIQGLFEGLIDVTINIRTA